MTNSKMLNLVNDNCYAVQCNAPIQ